MPTIKASDSYLVGYGLINAILSVFGLLANLAVIFIVLRSQKMRKSAMNQLLANLALAFPTHNLPDLPLGLHCVLQDGRDDRVGFSRVDLHCLLLPGHHTVVDDHQHFRGDRGGEVNGDGFANPTRLMD